MESRNDTDHIATVIYHNPCFLSVIEDNAEIMERETLYDSLKDYDLSQAGDVLAHSHYQKLEKKASDIINYN